MSNICRKVGCLAEVEHNSHYCESCGGHERAIREGLAKPRPQRRKVQQFKQKVFGDGKGACPVGQGLSKNRTTRSPKELAEKRKHDAAATRRRNARRELLLAAQPKKGGGGDKDAMHGKGTSKKSRRRTGKRRKQELRSGGKRRKK